jgi:K+-sensing histidine kinase KdpD
MGRQTVLVPVRYPLQKRTHCALGRAIEIAEERDADLSVLHVNLVHRDEDVSTDDLRHAVESEFGHLAHASYAVVDSFLIEETLLNEATQEGVCCVVLGRTARARWRQLLSRIVSTDVNIERFLREHIDVELVVV